MWVRKKRVPRPCISPPLYIYFALSLSLSVLSIIWILCVFHLQVKWLQQQHEKIRRKRDGPYHEIPTYSPYNILRQPNNYAIDPNTNPYFSYSPDPLLSSSTLTGGGGAGGTHTPRLEYRDVTSHLVFTDPLFKEQWYLVSKVCNLTALLSFILSTHTPPLSPTLGSFAFMFSTLTHTHSNPIHLILWVLGYFFNRSHRAKLKTLWRN